MASAILRGETEYTPYHFTTIASDGPAGNVDGAATLAKFNNPAAVAIDSQGNLVVADTDNHTIRLVTPQGMVTTLAGSPGNPGSADGQGAAARFNQPTGIAVDRVGNFIVADYGNLTIRRVTPQGVVTTIAGTAGSFQYADGVVSAARFIGPMAVATDRAGNIYVADSLEYLNIHTLSYDTIRRITPDGIVSTIAGTFAAPYDPTSPPAGQPVPAAAWFDRQLVRGITLDASNNVYIATGSSIMKLTPDGFIAPLKSNGSVFSATNTVTGITAGADGTIFFTDGGSIRKITSAGVATTIAGSSGSSGNADGSSADARFDGPRGLSIDAAGNLFVADSSNGTIRKITPDGLVTTAAGRLPGSADPVSTAFNQLLTNSAGLAIDAQGALYFSTVNSILKRSPDGTIATLAGVAGQPASVDGPGADARFLNILGFTADLNGDVYVIDQHAIRKITAAGAVTTLAGEPNNPGSNDGTGSNAHFNFPLYLTVDAGGNIYVADRLNYTVRKVTPTGTVTTLAGLANVSAYSDGIGSSARFSTQMGAIACDRTTGDIFVIDFGKLRKVTSGGTVTTGRDYGSLSLAMTADASGNLIVAGPTYIERISPSGVTSLLGGTDDPAASATPVSADGTGVYAHFDSPNSVAVATDGRIFVRQDRSTKRTLSVGTPNGTPIVGNGNPVTTPSNQSAYVTLPASDPDGDPLTFTITSTVGGTATVAGNLATFTPTPGGAGSGSISFTASDGYAASGSGTINVTMTPPVTMLANISTRGQVGTGDNVLIAGFVLNGPANKPKNVLVRAAGPSLAAQGVGQPLSRPVITLVQGGVPLASNQGWGNAGNAADIATTAAKVGAFGFAAGSNDSALLTQLLPGVYSALVSGANGGGISLVEVYDGETTNSAHHPVNVSTRGLVGTGDNVLIAGIAVSGTTPQKFLIRAIGPGLSVFNLGGRLADPQFHLYQGSTVLAQVTSWTNYTDMQAAVTQTGAFPLPAGSADAAGVFTLNPGNYTVIVSSRSSGSGIALVEVYQLP